MTTSPTIPRRRDPPSLLGGRDGGGRDGTRARTRAFLPPHPPRSASSAVRSGRRRARTPRRVPSGQAGALDDGDAIALAIARCPFAAHRVDRGSFPRASPGAAVAAAMGDGEPLTPSRWIAAATSVTGDALAGVDEGAYALGGLAPEQPAGGRLASAATLVALVADPRRRRALAAHGLAPVLRAALDLGRSVVDGDARRGGVIEAALGPDPETTRLAAAALLYLSAVGLPAEKAAKAYADGQLATVLEGLLTPSGRAASDTGAASRVRGGGLRRRSRAAPTRERRKPFARRSRV